MAIRDPEKSVKTTFINIPEAVGVFDTFEAQQAAFYDLRAVGFHHSDISLLGGQEALEEKLGKAYWRASDLEDDPRAPRAHFVSEEAIGELEGAIAGGFFLVGSDIAMAAMLGPASTLTASLAAIATGGCDGRSSGPSRGQKAQGILRKPNPPRWHLMWVHTRDEEREGLAVKIMKEHSGRDVHARAWSE